MVYNLGLLGCRLFNGKVGTVVSVHRLYLSYIFIFVPGGEKIGNLYYCPSPVSLSLFFV